MRVAALRLNATHITSDLVKFQCLMYGAWA